MEDKKQYKKQYIEYIAIIIFSILFFALFYGIEVLNPTNVDWLLSGGLDISQHYSGWIFFRKEAWRFPPGNFTGLSYPNNMSIIYMDSIPLLAVIFKLLQPILPIHFQYFGWYQLLCFVLQGILGVKLVKKYSENKIVDFLTGVLCVMTPAFLWRTFLHVALGSHWILLLALLSIFYYEEFSRKKVRIKVFYWILAGFFCTTIHLYFLPMCFIILCGYIYLDICRQKKVKWEQWFVVIGFWLGVLIPMFLLGGFIRNMKIADLNFTWKKTFNLNGFINPQGWSRWLPNLGLHTYGQSEGFAYLGLGVLIGIFAVIVMSCLNYLKNDCSGYLIREKLRNFKLQALAGIAIVSVLAAASPVVTLGNRAIVLPFPKKLEEIWMIFRASGRLVWPAVYVIVFTVCIRISQMKRKYAAVLLLLICVIFQGADISAKIWDRGKISREPEAFVSDLQDEGWRIIGTHPYIENIVYVNSSGLASCASMAEYADKYNLTLGKFYYARNYDDVIQRSAEQALKDKRKEDIFLFNMDRIIDAWNEPELFYYALDGKLLGYCEPIRELEDKAVDAGTHEYTYVCETTQESVNTEMIDEFLFLHAGGKAAFSDFSLPSGTYYFTVEGENLEEAKIVLSEGSIYEHGMQTISGTMICRDTITWKIDIENCSNHDMVLYRIKIHQ